MKKIGIITHYYNSLNYGGNLQAYALCKYLSQQGYVAEQISYELNTETCKNRIKHLLKCFIYGKKYRDFHRIRKNAFFHFNKVRIPHSDEVYTDKNIVECIQKYDIFITGSDQVWNLNMYRKPFFLDFVPSSKEKISYAASTALDSINEEQKEIFASSLASYKAISVRETNMVKILKEVTNKDISLVLDPTFLLDECEWEKVCDKNIIKEHYVFAYFLGKNELARDLAQIYANKKSLKLITIPYATGTWSREELAYGDVQILDLSPEKFLSLIKYADCVFTDSFHAVVFSFIFKKQFLVFNRDVKGSMNSRITSLLNMFDLQERFCATKEQEKIEYIESLQSINYNREFLKFEKCRESSYEFIRKNILE